MVLFSLNFFCGLLLTYCHRSICQRRIVHGNETTVEKRYMVYLMKAEHSDKLYDNWICGGAIVHPSFIVTSAACVEDVTYMYAIAGYNKYINPSSFAIRHDECIEKTKKRIVFSCLPKNYNFTYDKMENWAYIDIAAVKVDTPYNFETPISPSCSWIPDAIDISYDWRHMEPGKDAMVLGWGSRHKWRLKNDVNDYNQEYLQYSPVRIQAKSECKKYYERIPALLEIIDKYMICTMGKGNIDDQGQQIIRTKPSADGCTPEYPCKENTRAGYISSNTDIYRKQFENLKNNSGNNSILSEDFQYDTYGYNLPIHEDGKDDRENANKSTSNPDRRQFGSAPARRYGICQNDHGGPLITWVGKKEVLIGTASLFLIRNGSCVGPYLFTSTKCNGVFLSCVLTSYLEEEPDANHSDEEYRRFNIPIWFDYNICDLPPSEIGFEVIKRRISWPNSFDNPAAPAEPVEDLFERPQVPLSELN